MKGSFAAEADGP